MAPLTLNLADRSFFLAARAWGGTVDPRFWESISASWRARLSPAWESTLDDDPRAARDRLRLEHAAEARPNLGRIHPSWLIRALREEPLSVRRAVVANVPAAQRETLRVGLGLTPEDFQTDRPPQTEALAWALALWTERLVGDVSERRDDPLVIAMITRLGPRGLYRLIHTIGLSKWSHALDEPPALRRLYRERFEQFRRDSVAAGPRFLKLADRDVAALERSGRHMLARLGLFTVGRLLDAAEPYRVRWALQHVPYAIAKFTRSVMNPARKHDPDLIRWESEVLRAAAERLRSEGRLELDLGAFS